MGGDLEQEDGFRVMEDLEVDLLMHIMQDLILGETHGEILGETSGVTHGIIALQVDGMVEHSTTAGVTAGIMVGTTDMDHLMEVILMQAETIIAGMGITVQEQEEAQAVVLKEEQKGQDL